MAYQLSAKEREEAFPIHIELGRSMGAGGKKDKSMPYPTVYIDAIEGLDQLPKSGCMLVEFRRKRISVEENADGKEMTGVTLELHTLCLQEGAEDEDGPKSLDEAMGSGVDDDEMTETEEDDD